MVWSSFPLPSINRNAARIIAFSVLTLWHVAGPDDVKGATARVALHIGAKVRVSCHDGRKALVRAAFAVCDGKEFAPGVGVVPERASLAAFAVALDSAVAFVLVPTPERHGDAAQGARVIWRYTERLDLMEVVFI